PNRGLPSPTRLDAITGRPPDLVNPPPGCKFAARCPYAQARCLTEEPPLDEGASPGHAFRCFYPVGSDAGTDALTRNLAAGETAAGLKVSRGREQIATASGTGVGSWRGLAARGP